MIRQSIVRMNERGIVPVIDIVREVIDVQEALERNIVVYVAGLLEEIQPRDEVEPVIEELAEQLDLFGYLPLMLRVRDFLHRFRSPVEVRPDVPFDLPITRDRLQLQRIVQAVNSRDGSAEHIVAREVRPVGVDRVDATGVRRGIVEPDTRLARAEVRYATGIQAVERAGR